LYISAVCFSMHYKCIKIGGNSECATSRFAIVVNAECMCAADSFSSVAKHGGAARGCTKCTFGHPTASV
jgi:hypothetical protein